MKIPIFSSRDGFGTFGDIMLIGILLLEISCSLQEGMPYHSY